MYTKLENVVSELFQANITHFYDIDNHDLKELLRAYFIDNDFYVNDLLDVLTDASIQKGFEDKYNLSLEDDYPYKKCFPNHSSCHAVAIMTQLFLDYICQTPGDILEFISSHTVEIFKKQVEEAFDQVVCDTYGRRAYSSYDGFEYGVYCKTGRQLSA